MEGLSTAYLIPASLPLLLTAGASYFALRGRVARWLLIVLMFVLTPLLALGALWVATILSVTVLSYSMRVFTFLGVGMEVIERVQDLLRWSSMVLMYLIGFLVLEIAYLIRRR